LENSSPPISETDAEEDDELDEELSSSETSADAAVFFFALERICCCCGKKDGGGGTRTTVDAVSLEQSTASKADWRKSGRDLRGAGGGAGGGIIGRLSTARPMRFLELR